MREVKALFIDCDGVLYDKKNCTYHDMAVVGFGKAMEALNIPQEELAPTRAKLRAADVHGLLNAALDMCQKRNIPYSAFSEEMVKNTDYSRISEDLEMLKLLKECASLVPVYVVTNNSKPHLQRVLNCLNGGGYQQMDALNIHPITIEDTFYKGIFHPKKTGTQLTDLCAQVGEQPEHVLLLDDTLDVCDAALAQGLQVNQIQTPHETKMILRRVIYEAKRPKRIVSLRKTRGGIGD